MKKKEPEQPATPPTPLHEYQRLVDAINDAMFPQTGMRAYIIAEHNPAGGDNQSKDKQVEPPPPPPPATPPHKYQRLVDAMNDITRKRTGVYVYIIDDQTKKG